MRYFLLHVSTFVPICAKVLISPWGLKIPWCLYLFFTYILLEHRNFNGYPIKAFANLQRQAECCLILSLFLAYWISPIICVLPFLALVKAKELVIDSLSFSFMFFILFRFDLFQIIFAALSIMSALLQNTETVVATPEGWHRACTRRIMFRGVQVFCLMSAYESMYVRLLLISSFGLLKVCVYVYTPLESPDRVLHKDGDPVRLLQGRSHFL